MRRDYGGSGTGNDGLRESGLAAGWVEQFDRWFAEAVAAELPEPNAVVVATADADGAPDAVAATGSVSGRPDAATTPFATAPSTASNPIFQTR